MIAARLTEVLEAVNGRLPFADAAFAGVSTDTRTLVPGNLFVALRGEHHDGHDHADAARAAGAAALIVERELPVALPQLMVENTLAALADLARWWRTKHRPVVIGITGSNGKTSVKTLTAAICARAGRTHCNQGNYNNEVGLPLSVLATPADAEYAVFEMGAGQPGDIAYLAGIAKPTATLVNNVAPAHLERMHSLEGVAETKGAVYSALPDDGIAVINADDAFADYFRGCAGPRRRIEFGLAHAGNVTASEVRVESDHASFELHLPDEVVPVELPLGGEHNVRNALAAAALATAAGIGPEAIRAGLEGVVMVAGRLTRHRLPNGAVLIDDSYNANPGSLRAAIDTLALEPGQRWLVLGRMAELGPAAPELHAALGRHARAAGIDRLIAVGEWPTLAAREFGEGGESFASKEDAIAALRLRIAGGVTVLVKGSRSSAMEQVVAGLLGRGTEASHAH